MLQVEVPNHCPREARYVASVLFEVFLGIACDIREVDAPSWRISCPGHDGEIGFPDLFFAGAEKAWLKAESMPVLPLPRIAATQIPYAYKALETELPILFPGATPPAVTCDADRIAFSFDLPGAIFFMLSRYEETFPIFEAHGRFAAAGSVAVREGFLHRPIVNEYVELIWGAIHRLWPHVQRSARAYSINVTSDVDHLDRARFGRVRSTVRAAASTAIRQRKFGKAIGLLGSEAEAVMLGSTPYHDLPLVMDACEAAGHRAMFYFMVAATRPEYDARYGITEPHVLRLLRQVADRGHRIGLHNSYGSLGDGAQIAREMQILADAIQRAGATFVPTESRAHYLLWDPLKSARLLDEAGFSHDSTMGYSQQAGFRSGTCYPYPMYDLESRAPLSVVQRSLIMMESSVIEPQYMGLGHSPEAYAVMDGLKQACQWCDGEFVLLWHNSHLASAADRSMYRHALQ